MKWYTAASEGTAMAANALLKNKLRSILSVLGITIGIYCIIAVYALVHSLEKNLNDSFSGFGTDVVFVQKWPWDEIGGDYPWWKYLSRPQTNLEEAEFLKANLEQKFYTSLAFSFGLSVKTNYKNIELPSVRLNAISFEYNQVQKVDIESGRYFTIAEMQGGRPVVVIGAGVAENLFETQDPIGKKIRVKGHNCTVIGVCKREGKSILNNSSDDIIFIPAKFALSLTNYRKGEKGCQIMIKAAPGVSLDELSFETEQQLRRYRRIPPGEPNSFALNRMSMITNVISSLFSQVGFIGVIIGAFSMLVGCFGVANIMFVSVKERTQEIGIQKALGAKKRFILSQFLVESVLLCLLGGLIGLFMVWGTLGIMNYILQHQLESAIRLYLSSVDVFIGIVVSVMVGLMAGAVPAARGAALDPVEAIRSK